MRKIYGLLFLVSLLASFLRVFRIDTIPPSLTWDEAAVGYNAYTIANYGKDEYGKFFPLYFKSFGEDKQPIHIYTTALFVKFFGLNEVTTRMPSAVFGILNVILLYFVAKVLFKDEYIALLASFFLAISPQNIHFSRFNHEANFALFFFMLGLLFFLKSFKQKKYFLPLSIISFFLSTISYHAAEIAVPLICLTLVILYFKQLRQNKSYLLPVTVLAIGLIIFSFYQPRLFGINRFNQTTQGNTDVEKTEIFKLTHNYLLGRINLVILQYFYHFNPKYLFVSGDKNPILSSQGTGEFYKIDIIFLILGILYLIKNKSKEGFLLLGWALLGPLPSAFFAEAPHAARAMFMMGSWHLVSALGFYFFINFIPKFFWRTISLGIFLIILGISLQNYLNYYYGGFAKRYAIDWQYGMKQMVDYVSKHDEFTSIFITDSRHQPYIFFLYYLKTPLSDFLNTVMLNNAASKNYNNVAGFDKYYFEGDLLESIPAKGNLYILNSSEYDGLRYKSSFDIKKVILYPNETVAFYIVAAK